MIKGTKAEDVIAILKKIPQKSRSKVEEITLDMAGSMNQIARKCFPQAVKVIDRFHVQKLAYDALQEMRIAHRWDAINEETNALDNARWEKTEYIPFRFDNGDTKSNYWHAAATCYLNLQKNGLHPRNKGQRFYLPSTRT